MRIIAGNWKGVHLFPPAGTAIRPTSDRLREAIFNIVGNQIREKRVLDLFAGTGAMGLEALSRGAAHATFIDHSFEALALVRRNIAKVDAGDRSAVIRWDIARNLDCLDGHGVFDWVFVDPPYARGFVGRTLASVAAAGFECGQIVVEHDAKDVIDPIPVDLRLADQRRYGKTLVSFLGPMV